MSQSWSAETELTDEECRLASLVRTHELLKLEHGDRFFKIKAYVIGSSAPQAPTLFITGGVHGIERIGAELCMGFLRHTIKRLSWDQKYKEILSVLKVIFIPLVNPVGFHLQTRANPNGVDLMRNAPIDAVEVAPFLLGGQRYSNKLPWYRGKLGEVEKENVVLFDFFKKECFQSDCVVSLDCHSGFGLRDRLWFPYSGSRQPFAKIAELQAFFKLFEQIYPYHIYHIEPQCHSYLLNGDIWDYLYQEFEKSSQKLYLPLTLEMGSWIWVKKNPLQIISKQGLFNPVKKHRVQRTLRRHHLLFDFLLSALYSNKSWSHLDLTHKENLHAAAIKRWFG